MILRELLASFGLDFDEKGADKAHDAVEGLKHNLEQLAGLFAGSEIFSFFKETLTAADAFQQSVRRVNALFGEGAETILGWGEAMAVPLGRGAGSLYKLAAEVQPTIGLFAKSDKEAATMAKTMAELAVNMAGFWGEDDNAMLAALRGGLNGMDRPLKKYGIRLNDDALAEYAMAKGLGVNVKSMKDSEKVHLRYLKLLDATKKMHGQGALSLNRYGGAVKALKEFWEELLEQLGLTIIGPATKIVTWAREGIQAFLHFASNTELLKAAMWGLGLVMVGLIGPTFLRLLLAVAPLLIAFAAFAFVMDDVIVTFEGGQSVLGGFTAWLDDLAKRGFPGMGAGAKAALETVNAFREAIARAAVVVASFFHGMATGDWSQLRNVMRTMGEDLGIGQPAAAAKAVPNTPGAYEAVPEGSLPWAKRIVRGVMGAPTMYRPTAGIDNGGLASRQAVIQQGDKTFTVTVMQQPGESGPDFAKRVADILDERDAARDDALATELLPAGAP